ncbi:hypothetical protein G6N05_08690 [Flavobacterium sp. F372]|jgi:hypothetical protein|uniref:DUF4830 domain-containing protein n=1 Tax=Flavobacterium bernardetii TaxID=2813823 RepID=A0ABR7IXN3_9FLAO|nr:hypothetical protein [Flavobacterium bernardetii]MBC5834536.1 hypothetical protein [Flavobacterium bernardetii]NHF70184.1 hypothetical protein [Flavobacterium bernardetii]
MKKFIVVFLSFILLLLSYFGYKYFSSSNLEFDKVYHYVIADDDVPVQTLTHDISGLENSIIYEEYPYDLDSKFHEELTKVGFKKREIDKEKFSKLKEILKYEFHVKIGVKKCETTYRDVLVFQKNNKIVGVVKICFGCGQYCSIGENLPDFNFEKYKELGKLLMK